MTDVELNFEIATKLENKPPSRTEWLVPVSNVNWERIPEISPLGMWEFDGDDWSPRKFHSDPSAMVSLLNLMQGNAWEYEVANEDALHSDVRCTFCKTLDEPNSKGHYEVDGFDIDPCIMVAVRNASINALREEAL